MISIIFWLKATLNLNTSQMTILPILLIHIPGRVLLSIVHSH
ncbi:Uncharacterised protein [Klebsiella oxytoca]|nr:hypothetical protein AI2918V1_2350 [Klebsiella oxytoca]CAH5662457.1 hypothetical protein AI2991V1_3098 [Klebsiella oxytoca]CAH5879167.1 hypothetical protein AI2918V1_2350 [Klebsiella oxytoca]SAQ61758.1 Uncharacterised protein [Klebsiella oxytoca]